MNSEQFNKAKEISVQILNVNKELEIWEKELIKPSRMAYTVAWNNYHPTKMSSKIPDELFSSFRESAINHLKLRLIELEKEFGGGFDFLFDWQ